CPRPRPPPPPPPPPPRARRREAPAEVRVRVQEALAHALGDARGHLSSRGVVEVDARAVGERGKARPHGCDVDGRGGVSGMRGAFVRAHRSVSICFTYSTRPSI